MADFLAPFIETDPDALAQQVFDEMAIRIPGWEPHEGNLDVILIETLCGVTASRRDIDAEIPTTIFRYYGATIAGIFPGDATPASVDSTWTMQDNAGYTIPLGAVVAIPASGDEFIGFETIEEVVVPPGSTATDTGEVPLVAVDPGASGSDLSGGAAPFEATLVDSLSFVAGIALEGSTSGGADAEADAAYIARLVEKLRLMAPRPIVADDFAVFARDLLPSGSRATALDLYNPDLNTYDNDATVTVAIVDPNGVAFSSGTRAAVKADLEARRETGFTVFVINPTFTQVAVTYTAVAYADADTVGVRAAANAALAEYLSPARWGTRQVGERPPWINDTKVRLLELATVLNEVDGLDYVTSLTFGVQGGSLGTADLTLAGAAPLTQPGTISGTVLAPS